MDKRKIIIDTDIGDDIDDAFAVVAALKIPWIELIGITTVFLNTQERAKIVSKILQLANKKDIPVFAGSAKTLDEKDYNFKEHTCQYTEDLQNYTYSNALDGIDCQAAIDFIVNSAKKYKEELTIICIGPLTNIAKAFIKNEEAMKKVRIVSMGGDFHTQFREWNILCDSKAAKIVLDSSKDITMIGLEVTLKTELSFYEYEKFKNFLGDELISYLQQLCLLWETKNHRLPVMHDPLTLFSAIFPEIVFTEEALVKVETDGQYGIGTTYNLDYLYSYLPKPLEGKRIKIGKAVNEKKFIEKLMNILYS